MVNINPTIYVKEFPAIEIYSFNFSKNPSFPTFSIYIFLIKARTKTMKRAEKKRRARKFNVCKKLCQLNKVAVLFSIQYNEQTYQRQCLSDLYSGKIGEVLNNSWEECSKQREIMNSIYPEIRQKYHQLYGKKYQSLKIDFNVFHQSKLEETERKIKMINCQMNIQQHSLNSINTKIQNANLEDKLYDDFKENLNKMFKTEKQKYLQQRNKLLADFTSKVSSLKNQYDAKIEQMRQEYKKIKNELTVSTNSHSINTAFVINFSEPYSKRLKELLFSIKNLENKFLAVKITSENQKAKLKDQITSEINNLATIQNHNYEEIRKKSNLLNQFSTEECQNQISTLRNNLRNLQTQNAIDENNQQTKLNEIIKSNQNQFQILELNQKGRISNFDSIFNNLRKSQETELQSIQIKIKQAQKSIQDRLIQKQTEIDEFNKSSQSIESKLLNDFNNTKSNYSKETNSLESEFNKQKKEITEKHLKSVESIQFKCNQLTKVKQSLEQERKSNETRFRLFYTNIEKEEMDELQKLEADFKRESSELKNQLNKDLSVSQTKLQKHIKKVEDDHFQQKKKKIEEIQFLYTQEIIGTQFHTQKDQLTEKEKKEIIKDYEKTYEDLNSQLNEIEPPVVNENFAQLSIEIDSLKKRLNDQTNLVRNDRNQLNLRYQKEIEQENQRHRNVMKEFKEIFKLINTIDKVRQDKVDQIRQLQNIQKHSQESIDKIQSDFRKQIELIELHYSNQKSLKLKQIELTKTQISTEKEKIRRSMFDLKTQHEIQLRNHQSLLNDFLKQQSTSMIKSTSFDEMLNKIIRSHRENVKKLRDRIHDYSTANQILRNDLDHKLLISHHKNKKRIEKKEIQLKAENDHLTLKKEELKTSLLSLMKAKNNPTAKPSYKSLPSDEERIRKLTARLNTLNYQLNSLLNEYKKVKKTKTAQDTRITSPFGKSQSVGVLLTTGSTIISPRYNFS